jgi:hypothetical protein
LEVKDPDLKRALLTNLVAPERAMSERAAPAKLAAIVAGVGDLADLELSQNQPEDALATLDAAPFADGSDQAPRLNGLRCSAALALGRLEDAQQLDADADSWLRGLEMSRTPAAEALAAFEARFASLTPQQKQRLEILRPKAKASEHARTPEVGPPSPQ